MGERTAWEDLAACPRERPFWCSHPHCLFCNWDDDSDHGASALAAYLGATPLASRRYDPQYPEAHYVQERHYVAWLCWDCAGDEQTLSWFCDTVTRVYPEAVLIKEPGTPDEGHLVRPMSPEDAGKS